MCGYWEVRFFPFALRFIRHPELGRLRINISIIKIIKRADETLVALLQDMGHLKDFLVISLGEIEQSLRSNRKRSYQDGSNNDEAACNP